MTKAHELRIFFDCARKTIVFVRLTTVRLSVCNSSSQLTYTRGYCISHDTEGPQTELRSQTDLPTNQPHQIQYWQNQQNNPRQNQQQNHESIQVQPVEQHGICDRVFKAIKTKKHHSFICFDIEEFYPSISQDLLNRALDLASTYDVTNDEETSCNTCKTFDPYAQTATLVKEG